MSLNLTELYFWYLKTVDGLPITNFTFICVSLFLWRAKSTWLNQSSRAINSLWSQYGNCEILFVDIVWWNWCHITWQSMLLTLFAFAFTYIQKKRRTCLWAVAVTQYVQATNCLSYFKFKLNTAVFFLSRKKVRQAKNLKKIWEINVQLTNQRYQSELCSTRLFDFFV